MADVFDVLTCSEFTDRAGEKKTRWTTIGVGFPAKDGNGFNVTVDATPVNGKIVIRRRKPREDRGQGRTDAPAGRETNTDDIPF